MAKRVILEAYSFDPTARTVTVNGRVIRQESLVLITNVTSNTVIYNFADSSLGYSEWTISTSGNVESTVIKVATATSSMNSADKLQIIIDEVNETFQPSETLQDPVGKLRVSQPQALIDTDFEYGVQSTKWETLSLMNNRPAAFYDPTSPVLGVTNIAGNGTRLVTVSLPSTTGITTSTPMYVQDTTDPAASGWVLPFVVTGNVSFTYYARGTVVNSSVFDSTKTYVYIGTFYTGSGITLATGSAAAFTFTGSEITVTTTYAHGLQVGSAIYVVGTTASSNPPNGAWFIRRTPTTNTAVFDVATGTPGGAITASGGATASLYARTWGTSVHRPFDGGVTFTAGYPYHANQLIRQTRRYFRYQSGKGIQFSTGSNLCSPYQVDLVTSSGATVTVQTKFPHNAGVGAVIKVSGVSQSLYNGTFTITSIPSDITFTYTASSTPETSTGTGAGITIQPYQWYGASLRIGMFDSQNGFFFQYDGQTVFAVRRSSTTQLKGWISALTSGSQSVTGTTTRWSDDLVAGDQIVIRGMTHTVIGVESQTSMTIYPEYRGTSISSPSQVQVSKTIDLKIPQSQWNIDKMDGTGQSKFNLDITKMQMWYMDYSWYGAGAIRWGFKNQRGEVIYCHRLAHGNNMTEAYMRSGNLPARYEVNTFWPYTEIVSTVQANETSAISVISTEGFPPSGTVALQQPSNSGTGGTNATIEYISYSSKTATSFSGLVRGKVDLTGPGGLASGGGTATPTLFTYSSGTSVLVTQFSPQSANTISHWGSSVIMDGRYDDDKSLVFLAGMSTAISNIGAGVTQPLISVRVAPAVDSGITGTLGQRELINRMQLILRSMAAYTTGASMTFLITLRLNGALSGGTFASAGGSSLSQVAFHTSGQTITGGETVYGFFTTTPGVTDQDLAIVRDIGNSILGGGNTLTVPTTANNKYPDGPDIITVCATNVTAVTTNSINARINWTEAQA
jgi:hypothetical protein